MMRGFFVALLMMVFSMVAQADVKPVNDGLTNVSYCGLCHQDTKAQNQNSLQNQNFERMPGNSNATTNMVKVRPGSDTKHKIMNSKCGSFAKVKLQKDHRVSGGGSFGGIRI
jgi:hypothetical protein